jgi:hypothetical protein
VRLRPYTRQALKWLGIALLFYAVTAVVSQVAWSHMMAGSGYVLLFGALLILGSVGTVALAVACYWAMLAV